MELSCDQCLARLSTGEEPIPGHTYRVPCVCGNTMVVEIGASGEARPIATAELRLLPSPHDDPFARAVASMARRVEVTGPIGGRLAARDPDAPLDDSAEFPPAGAVSFDDLLRRARMKGFLAGAAAGALGAAAIAIALSLATSRPVATTTIRAIEPLAESAEPARPAPEKAGARARPAATARRATGEGIAPARRAAFEAPAEPAPDDRPLPEAQVAEAELPPPDPQAGVGLDLAPKAVPGDAGAAPAPEAGAAAPRPPAEGAAAVAVPAAAPRVASKGKAPFPARDVADALRSRRAAIADCVATTPGSAPAARGQRFALTVVVDPNGRVSDVQIDDPEIEATPLGVCLLRLAQGMSFAPFEGEPFRVELALGYGDSE
jgi:hypothetical protein